MKYPIIFVSGVALRWEFFKSLKKNPKKRQLIGDRLQHARGPREDKGMAGWGGCITEFTS